MSHWCIFFILRFEIKSHIIIVTVFEFENTEYFLQRSEQVTAQFRLTFETDLNFDCQFYLVTLNMFWFAGSPATYRIMAKVYWCRNIKKRQRWKYIQNRACPRCQVGKIFQLWKKVCVFVTEYSLVAIITLLSTLLFLIFQTCQQWRCWGYLELSKLYP